MDPLSTAAASSAAAAASAAVSSSSENTNHLPKVRSACNRCHRQKLRCVRNLGEFSCERCQKLHTLCRYGPRAPRTSLKPPIPDAWHEKPSMAASIPIRDVYSHARNSGESTAEWLQSLNADVDIVEDQVTDYPNICFDTQGDGVDMYNIWSDPFYEPGVVNPLDQYGFPDMNPVNEQQLQTAFPIADTDTYPRIVDDDAQNHSDISCPSVVRKLANLNVSLFECSVNLTFKPDVAVNAAELPSSGRRSQKTRLFAIDELFRFTSEFIDTIKSLSPCAGGTLLSRDQSAEALPSVEYSQQLSHTNQSVTRAAAPLTSFSIVDEATMLMIMSCHSRLTETYLSIFQMMQACIKYSTVPPIDKDSVIILSRLQLGSYTAPEVRVDANSALESGRAGRSGMYMLLVTILSSQLCEKLAQVMEVGVDVPMGSESASQRLFAATITERTVRLGRTIDATKHLLQEFSLVLE